MIVSSIVFGQSNYTHIEVDSLTFVDLNNRVDSVMRVHLSGYDAQTTTWADITTVNMKDGNYCFPVEYHHAFIRTIIDAELTVAEESAVVTVSTNNLTYF